MSSRRQKSLARVNWYIQSSLKHFTEYITGNKSYYRGGRYRQVSLYIEPHFNGTRLYRNSIAQLSIRKAQHMALILTWYLTWDRTHYWILVGRSTRTADFRAIRDSVSKLLRLDWAWIWCRVFSFYFCLWIFTNASVFNVWYSLRWEEVSSLLLGVSDIPHVWLYNTSIWYLNTNHYIVIMNY